MRVYDVPDNALALPVAQGGIPLEATDDAWAASSATQWFKQVNFTWIGAGSPFAGPIDHPFVFLELMHQTDPMQNGVWKYVFATGKQFTFSIVSGDPVSDLELPPLKTYDIYEEDGNIYLNL